MRNILSASFVVWVIHICLGLRGAAGRAELTKSLCDDCDLKLGGNRG